MLLRHTRRAGLALFTALVAAGCASSSDEPADSASVDALEMDGEVAVALEDETAEDEELPADEGADEGGEQVSDAEVAVVVPAPGESVHIAVHAADGTTTELSVTRDADGTVRAPVVRRAHATGTDAATPACRDGAFDLGQHVWRSTLVWKFRAGSTPSTNARSRVATALRRSASNITGSRNDCGLGDEVSATHAYKGRTRASSNVVGSTSSVRCGRRDGRNVVGFGVLPAGTLGVACSWSDASGTAVESDIKLNDRRTRWYTGATPGGCSNRYSVEAVATHEFGHAFGLGHVSEGGHGALTMSTHTNPCSTAGSSLGLGDVRALRQRYREKSPQAVHRTAGWRSQ